MEKSDGRTTIVGIGSLLSERSALGTFPRLSNFRLARLPGAAWRRVFAHPAAFFFEKGIAKWESKEICSLSCEPHDFLVQERTRQAKDSQGQASTSSRGEASVSSSLSNDGDDAAMEAPSFQVFNFFNLPICFCELWNSHLKRCKYN